MRSRTFYDETTSKSYPLRWIVNGRPQTDTYELCARTLRVSHMDDVVTKSFSRVRNQGGIVCSPMYKETLYWRQDLTGVSMDGTKGGLKIHSEFSIPNLLGQSAPRQLYPDHVLMDQLYAKYDREVALSITRAHAEVDVSEMQLLATLGELPETLSWIKSLVERVLKLTRAFKNKAEAIKVLQSLKYSALDGDISDAKKAGKAMRRYLRYMDELARRKNIKLDKKAKTAELDAVSNLWLEWRYALRPLINDLKNALAVLDKIIKSQRLTARGKEYSIGRLEDSVTETVAWSSMNIHLTAKIEEEESVKARAGVLYAVQESCISLLTILGFDQPIESAYELIPFSFIFDWVFSIGDLLASWFKSSGLDMLTSWSTLRVEWKRNVTLISCNIESKGGYVWSNPQVVLGSSTTTAVWKWRYPDPAIPLLPRFDLKLDLGKIIDLGTIGRALTGGQLTEVTKRSLRHA